MGKDKKIRSAKVLIAPHGHLHRPLKLLYPLECPDSDFQTSDNHGDMFILPAAKETGSREQESETVTPVPNEVDHQESEKGDKFDFNGDSSTTTHSKRKAIVVARMKIKNWLNPEETLLIG